MRKNISKRLFLVFGIIVLNRCNIVLGPVVQTLDSAIHWINHYPVDKYLENQLHRLHYPLDRDLSAG